MPLELSGQQLLVQRGHVRVALEEMVVVAIDPRAIAEIERARLSTDIRPSFVERYREAFAKELARGDEAGDPGTDDGDPHGHRAERARPMPEIRCTRITKQ
jgi:hypothetical protein